MVKLSKFKLKKIIGHFCIDIEASKVAKSTGISRNTVNKYYNVFRKLIFEVQNLELKRLTGEIEIDKSYFRPSRVRGCRHKLKRVRSTIKQPVFGIFELNGRVYTEMVPDCQKPTLQTTILGKVSLESIIHTDIWYGYHGLVDIDYNKYFRVKPTHNEFAKKGKGININGIESSRSFTKRRLSKFNGVKKNFNHHLEECE